MIRIETRIFQKTNPKDFLTVTEFEQVYELINTSGEISKISGQEDWDFNKNTLKKWCSNDIDEDRKTLLVAIVKYRQNLKDTEKIIGFCTLTNKEANFFQNRDIELCHVIIHKKYRRVLNGTKMVYMAIEEAFKLNYENVYGRVFKENEIGKSFIKHLNWVQIDIKDNDCIWYVFKYKDEKFSTLIFRRMQELDKMTISQLSALLGMSKQYIGSLKNPLVGHITKLPSPQLLSQLCLILGQKNASIFRQFFSDLKNKVFWKDFYEYLLSNEQDKRFNRIYENLDYEVVNKLLLSYVSLQKLQKGYIFGEDKIGLNEKEIIDKEFRNKNKENINTDYEIWTVSDTLAEQLDIKYAETTVKNILDFGIKYRFFVSVNDKTNWRLAIKNILFVYEKFIKEITYSSEWGTLKSKNIDQYVHIYGIPDNMLYTKFRIFDAKGANSIGSMNIGGRTEDEVKFIELPLETKSKVKDILNSILVCEQISDSKLIEVYDYSMRVEKKFPNL